MKTNTIATRPEQLELLDASGVPVKLRLDERTRRLGLSQVQVMREILEAQATRSREQAEAKADIPARHAA